VEGMSRPEPLPVFYDPRQHTDANVSMSPSAGKPAQVMARWEASGIPIVRMPVAPATPEQLGLAHDRVYVDGVLAGQHNNGFGNRLPEVAATLPWTTGSMVSAAEYVARHGGVAISPTSGFHHARLRGGGGFCTFNGLMVAVRVLQTLGLARKIGILDIDMHYGDGTDDIIRRLDVRDIHHWTFGAHYGGLGGGDAFIRELPAVLAGFDDRDVVLYQAGADPFIDDPLGGVLTFAELRMRDRLVFRHFARTRVPLAWNLAGGYARDEAGTIAPVLAIHEATLEECSAAYAGA
jgi:acetoin utilization deacetylase AcuC-like enzyme